VKIFDTLFISQSGYSVAAAPNSHRLVLKQAIQGFKYIFFHGFVSSKARCAYHYPAS